jgi:hypothetical protein
MAKKGFLLVLMQPPPAFEEEFNAWYDTEHVPERLAVPGFETGLRFVGVSGAAPRYLAIYDLASPEVLRSEAYLRVAFERSSPWTKRVTSRVRVWRYAGEQLHPGDRVTGRCARLTLLRFRGAGAGAAPGVAAGMRAAFEGRPETRQVRVLVGEGGNEADVLGLVEARAPSAEGFDLAAFGPAADTLDLVGTYAPW